MTATTTAKPRTAAAQLKLQPGLGLLVIAAAGLVSLWAARADSQFAVFWLMGMAFGFVLQRSRFCFTSAFRDLFLLRDGRVMKGVIAGMAVATVGFTLIMSDRLPNARLDVVAPEAHVSPLALALVVGGLAFGLGMVLAGGCVSGSMYRMAEGYLGSWVAFGGIMAGLVVAAQTWNWWWELDIGRAPRLWLPNIAGYGVSVAATLLALAGAYVFILWWESRGGLVIPLTFTAGAPAETFGDELRQTYRSIFVRGWPAISGGLALGTLSVFLFAYEHPWRITGEISAWASALAGKLNLGLAPPPLLGVETLAGCTLSGADGRPSQPHDPVQSGLVCWRAGGGPAGPGVQAASAPQANSLRSIARRRPLDGLRGRAGDWLHRRRLLLGRSLPGRQRLVVRGGAHGGSVSGHQGPALVAIEENR